MKRFREQSGNCNGSVIVEFVVTFPAFLLLVMAVFEVGFMFADKHIMKLAAFEAARSIVQNESDSSNPCNYNAKMKAKKVAARLIASFSPPARQFLHDSRHLGSPSASLLSQLEALEADASIPKALKRTILGWPTANAFTSIACTYDENDKSVSVDVTHLRAAKMPLIGPLMWTMYLLMRLDSGTDPYDTKLAGGFYGLELRDQSFSPSSAAALRNDINGSMDLARQYSMDSTATATLLDNIPGFNAIYGSDVSGATGINTIAGHMISEIQTLLARVDQNTLNAADAITASQSKILTGLLYATPENFRMLPIKTNVRLVMGIVGPDATEHPASADPTTWTTKERGWTAPRIKGIAKLTAGSEWRKWLKKTLGGRP